MSAIEDIFDDAELNRLKDIEKKYNELVKQVRENFHGPFICGNAGSVDDMGLHQKYFICPTYGLDGFAVYKKERDYDAPGY